VNFGHVNFTGRHAATLPEVVRNPNARPLRITGAQIGTPYAITADACLAHPIPPQGSCTITVQFAPTTLGASAQILTVDSAAGTSATQLSGTGDAVLTISPPPPLPIGACDVSYQETITATGGAAPYTFSVTSGALPPGLSMSPSTGVISGTPTAGSYTFTITATDSSQTPNTGSQNYTIQVGCLG
jgi:large repetitive protein